MRPRALLAAALALFAAGRARADPVPSLDLRGFSAPIDPASGVSIQPVEAPATGEWSAGLWTQYAYRLITLRDAQTNAVLADLVRHQVSSDFTASVGLWRRLLVGLDLPVVVYQTGDPLGAAGMQALGGPYTLPRQAFGDLGLDARVTLVRPTAGDLGGFALAFQDRLTLPIGDPASFLGEGVVTDEAKLLAEYRLGVRGTAGVDIMT